MSQINDGFVLVEKGKQQNTLMTRQIQSEEFEQNKLKENPNEQNIIKEKKELLESDFNIVSLDQEEQARTNILGRKNFVRDVKRLNDRDRGVDTERVGEKDRLTLKLNTIKQMKVKDSKGKDKDLPSDIRDVLSLVNDYTLMGNTARENANQRGYTKVGLLIWAFKVAFNIGGSRKELANEHDTMAKMIRKLGKLIGKYETKTGYNMVVLRLRDLRNTLVNQSGAVRVSQASKVTKFKKKWRNFDPGSKVINGVGKKLETTADTSDEDMKWILEKNIIEDRSDWPLFAHKPSYEDIAQGAAGNCFFLAALASIPGDKIRDMMLDNGDGTVTVRFYDKDATSGKRVPVYVTVDKKVKINSSLDCLWVQVMEKAYALFRQNRSNNIMVFTERQEKDQDGFWVNIKNKKIAEDVIDLGYLANGGQSQDVLADLLGTESEYIDVDQTTARKTIAQICVEAAQQADPKGAAYLKIERLKKRFKRIEKRIDKIAQRQGKFLADYVDYRDSMENYKNTIKLLEEEKAKTTDQKLIDNYNQKIEKQKNDMKKDTEEVAPIIGILNEYYAAKQKMDDEINELTEKYDLKEDQRDRHAHEEYNAFGMEKEATAAYEKVIDFVRKYTNLMLDERSERSYSVVAFVNTKAILSKLLSEFIQEVATSRKMNVNTATVTDYQALIRDAIRRVKEGDKSFTKLALKFDKLDALLGGDGVPGAPDEKLVNDRKKKAVLDISKEFLVSIMEKMIPSFEEVDGIQRATEIGQEDPVAAKYFNKLTAMINSGQCVCIGTREVSENANGTAGEGMTNGMVGGHAYTVMGTGITDNGIKVVKLRNPWAAYVVDYKEKKGVLETHAIKQESSGIFWIEMNHLMKFMDTIHGSGRSDVA